MKTKVGTYTKLVDKYGRSISKVYYRFPFLGNNAGKGKPHQGAKECARRVAQNLHGMCYVHGAQYTSL